MVITAKMTSVLPTTVTRMRTRKTATAKDLGQAMLTRYEFIEGTPTLSVVAVVAGSSTAPAPDISGSTVLEAVVVWMRSRLLSKEPLLLTKDMAVERSCE